MGQSASSSSCSVSLNEGSTSVPFSNHVSSGATQPQQQHVQKLLEYARVNYTQNPTEALAALLHAIELQQGPEAAEQARKRFRNELQDDLLADHVLESHAVRTQRAQAVLQQLLDDKSTLLHENGQREDLLRQTMQDGSSVICTKCNSVVSSDRWQQHAQYWCEAIVEPPAEIDDEDANEGKSPNK